MRRDFTYIDDIVEGVVRVTDRVPAGNPDWSGEQPDPGTSRAPYRIYNIGNHAPVDRQTPAAPAARRRSGHLGRRIGFGTRHRVRPRDPRHRRRLPLRHLVPGSTTGYEPRSMVRALPPRCL
jgi:nucleoside-diphosphate-sugar epimerase